MRPCNTASRTLVQRESANSSLFLTPTNAHEPNSTLFTVNAADLGNVWIRGGATAGSLHVATRRYSTGATWSAIAAITLNTIVDTPPVVTTVDHHLHENQWAQISSWFTYTDADGDPAVQYRFDDFSTGANSSYFWTPTTSHELGGTSFTVNASDLANVWIRGGAAPVADTISIQAFDGTDWSTVGLFNGLSYVEYRR